MPSNDSQSHKPTELPSYSLHDDAPRGWRLWIRGIRLVILLFILAVLAFAIFGAKPLYHEIKARRAIALAEKAGIAFDAGDVAEAGTLLRQAALMAFDDPRVAALVTYHAARSGDMASVTELGKKLDNNNASIDEILVFGERSLGAGKIEDAVRAFNALPENLPAAQTVRRTGLLAGVFVTQQQLPDAAAALRETITAVPTSDSDSLRIMLANILLLDKSTPSNATEARTLLEEASTNASQEGLAALRILAVNTAGISPNAQSSLTEIISRLRTHPAFSDSDEIFIARLLASSDPANKESAIADLVKRLNENHASLDTRSAAARWLVSIQANEPVLDLITEEDAASHNSALMPRVDALSGLNRWDDTEKLIESNRGGTLPDPYYHLFRARIAETRNNASTAESEKRLLRQAIQFAELNHVLFVARYAESVNWKPEAFAAWKILATDDNARAQALRGQLRTLPTVLPATDGADIATELLALQPNDPSARLSAAYFSLLAGQKIDESAVTVEELLAAEPESTDVRRVAALARLRTGKATQGLIVLPDSNDEPRWQALKAALLRAAGRTDEAKRISSQINRDTLSPDEQNFLEGL